MIAAHGTIIEPSRAFVKGRQRAAVPDPLFCGRSADVAGPPTGGAAIGLAQAAFRYYSWMSPPRRSRRLISFGSGLRTLRGGEPPGGFSPRPWCSRSSLNASCRSKAAGPGDERPAP